MDFSRYLDTAIEDAISENCESECNLGNDDACQSGTADDGKVYRGFARNFLKPRVE
ncbi:MAG: hypothetical protein JWP25_4472 [Bradyrhizobium sp.]|nr:hypothetical protein [Bradyrhizobium sp.]